MCHILRIIADTYSFYDNDHFLMTHAFLRHQMWNLASHLEAATTIQQGSKAINYPSFTPFILETMLQTSAAQCTHEQWRREERASGGSKGLEGLSLSGLGSIIIVAFVVVVIL